MDDARVPDLQAFNQRLAKVHLRGQWTAAVNTQGPDGPAPMGIPYAWRWDDVVSYLHEACAALPEAMHARRNLTFDNPALERYTTHTLAAGVQLIQPGEIAWPHRHTATALRFVVDGDPDMVTVVDGVAYPMENYDLILTPKWRWHGHHNRSQKNAIWVDLLDVPLILSFNQTFVEEGEIGRIEPDGSTSFESPDTPGYSDRPYPVPIRFAWRDMEARLREAAKDGGDPFDGASCAYNDPETGGSTLPSVSCHAHLLQPGQATKRHRHTSSAVYVVVEGEGTTVVGDTELTWSKHDTFCVPNWSWHHHVNMRKDADALLFSMNDSPMLAPFDLNREEAAPA